MATKAKAPKVEAKVTAPKKPRAPKPAPVEATPPPAEVLTLTVEPKAKIDPNYGPFPGTQITGWFICLCGHNVQFDFSVAEDHGEGKHFKTDEVCQACSETHHMDLHLSRDFDGDISRVVLARWEAENGA